MTNRSWICPRRRWRNSDSRRKRHATLQQALAKAAHPAVRQDLEILIDAAADTLRGTQLAQTRLVQYTALLRAAALERFAKP